MFLANQVTTGARVGLAEEVRAVDLPQGIASATPPGVAMPPTEDQPAERAGIALKRDNG